MSDPIKERRVNVRAAGRLTAADEGVKENMKNQKITLNKHRNPVEIFTPQASAG